MRALTLVPRRAGSTALTDVPEPAASDGALLVDAVAVGVCGTDREIVEGALGEAPPGRERLVLGHESLGRVVAAPPGAGLAPGDLVVGIVRRPDPLPCANCAVGEWDMCRNGGYTERGIKQRDGFASERFRLEPEYAMAVPPTLGALGVLLEPASVVAKAWEHVDRIGQRAVWQPRRALITGAGPIGLLAAMMAAQRGLEVHVLDRVADGPKPALVREIGTYHTGAIERMPRPDVVVECTGVDRVVLDAIRHVGPGGTVCLVGLGARPGTLDVDVAALNRDLVVENAVVFGSVNANRRHWAAAVAALERADRKWLEGMITRRFRLDRWREALTPAPGDVKTIVEIA